MPKSPLTQSEIDTLTAKLQMYKYLCAVGPSSGSLTVLGPLKSAPKIEPDIETREVKLYETGAETQAEIITKDNYKLTLELEDVDKAAELHSSFKKGDNILASSRALIIVLHPITNNSSAKTITFGNAYLRPGFTPTFEDEDDPNYAMLEYTCKPVISSAGSGGAVTVGSPFSYAVVTSGGLTIS